MGSIESSINENISEPPANQVARPGKVICMGASAGGLEPLEAFFSNVPIDTDWAYVVVQHLSATHKSSMVSLLERRTDIPVQHVEDNMLLGPGQVYLIPPGKILTIEAGRFQVSERPKGKHVTYPVDKLFASAAAYYEADTVGIILSGSGTDGTQGIRAIKDHGGLAMVQEPQSAQFDHMPRNALQTGLVDFVEMPTGMQECLATYFKRVQTSESSSEGPDAREYLVSILRLLKNHSQVNLFLYRESLLLRRIRHRAPVCGCDSIASYHTYLMHHEEEVQTLFERMMVGVTAFFRDKEVFKALENEIIPAMFEAYPEESLRIWVPGCATGEEAYSIAMLILDYKVRTNSQRAVKIFATDVNPKALQAAMEGIYPESIASQVPQRFLSRYFTKEYQAFQIKRELREMVLFTRHDLIMNAPFNRLHFISCRNLMYYFQPTIQQKLFSLFNFSLKLDGFLLIGNGESAEAYQDIFQPVFDAERIYRATFATPKTRGSIQLSASSRPSLSPTPPMVAYQNKPQASIMRTSRFRRRNQILTSLAKGLVEDWIEACLLIDQQYELVVNFGNTRKFLTIPNAPDGLNVLNMLPPEIGSVIRTGVARAVKSREKIPFQYVPVHDGEEEKRYTIWLKAIYIGEGSEPLVMVMFQEEKEVITPTPLSKDELSMVDSLLFRVRELETEVEMSRETLQNTVEELQASNEELLTSNEELQATVEELQSVNEELQTINEEYQATIRTSTALNKDMRHLMESSNMGVLFLDSGFRIRKFNELATQQINIGVSDHGRPISHFSTKLDTTDFLGWIEEVQRSGEKMKWLVENQNGRTLQIRISPCRYRENDPAGILVLFHDLTDIQDGTEIREIATTLQKSEKETRTLREELKRLEADAQRKETVELMHTQVTGTASILVSINGKVKKSMGTEILTGEKQVESGAFIQDFLPEELADLFHSRIRKSLELEEAQYCSFTHPDSGKTFDGAWVMYSGHEVCIFLHDISNLVQQNQILDKRDMQFRLLASNVPEGGVIIFDQDMVVLRHDAPISELPRAGESLTSLPHQDFIRMRVDKALNGQRGDMELSLKGDNYLLDFIPYGIDPGEYGQEGMLVYHRITEARRTKRALEARLRDMERFTYSVSHDLKTPLRTITSFSQLLLRNQMDSLNEEGQEYLGFIVRNTRRMARLVGGLLDYARLGADDQEVVPVDMNKLLPGLEQSFQIFLEEHNAKLSWSALPQVMAYAPWVLQVLQNLVENGIKFNESEDKVVHVSSTINEGMAILSVQDNGIGISPQYKNKIFEVFQHLNNREQYEGSGLGLAVCKQIVEHLGGTIWLDSTPGEGTTFYFSLPLAQ